VTTHTDETEIVGSDAFPGWALGEWADLILERAGVGVTIVDRNGSVLFYNKWAAEHLDRSPNVSVEMSVNAITGQSPTLDGTRCFSCSWTDAASQSATSHDLTGRRPLW
jgi:hypothetical protein